MTDLVKFGSANLPSAQALATALRNVKTDAGGSGDVLLRMDRTGHWVYGADQTEVEDEAQWAVNPLSFVHGYIAWGDGEVLGEMMTSVQNPLPELEPIPAGAKKGWEKQVGCHLKCINGEDAGQEVRYTATSVGGKKAVSALALAVAEQVDKDQDHPVAVVELGASHYQHKSYGKIFTPEFTILDWLTMEGQKEAPEAEPEEEAPPARRRRRAAA